MWTLRLSAAAVIAALLAAGCGGGGGGDVVIDQPPPPTQVQITMANQDAVARASIAAIVPFTSLPAIGVSDSGGTPIKALDASIPAFALKSLTAGFKLLPAAGDAVRPLAVATYTEPCMVSGSITVTVNDADDSATPTAGDSVAFAFNQCSDDVGQRINGTMSLTFSSVSITPTVVDLVSTVTLQQLTMVDQDASLTAHGSLNLRSSETTAADAVTEDSSYTVAASGLTVGASGTVAGFADTIAYYAGFNVTQRYVLPVGGPGTTTITARGNFHSATLNGDLALATLQPFVVVAPEDNPGTGQLDVLGANNTKLELTAMPEAQVRMDVCGDGDGAWEATKIVDWNWLMS